MKIYSTHTFQGKMLQKHVLRCSRVMFLTHIHKHAHKASEASHWPLALSLMCGGRSRGAPRSLRGWLGVGERELADDTGLARSAYMSSESALRTELLLDEADDTDDTLLTLRDLWREITFITMSVCNWVTRQAAGALQSISWGIWVVGHFCDGWCSSSVTGRIMSNHHPPPVYITLHPAPIATCTISTSTKRQVCL